MQALKWLLQPQIRFIVALSASIGAGQIMIRAFNENLGAVPGVIVGALATAGLALALSLVLAKVAQVSNSATRD